MQPRIYWIVAFAAVIFVGRNAAAVNEKDQSGKDKYPHDEEFYLEDQGNFEGSGRGGSEFKDDLEASGSGLGPDDEDGDDGHSDYNHNRIDPATKPVETNPPYIEDPHKAKNIPEDLAPKRDDNGIDLNGSAGVDSDDDPDEDEDSEDTPGGVLIMNPKHEDRASSFFAQPGVLAAVIGGAVVGLLCAILVVMFIVYRMRKKDEGSYALDEPRRSPAAATYPKAGAPHHNREFYA